MKASPTPFYDAIAALQQQGPRFFVPGHKGQAAAIPAFGDFLRWDFTEVEGACDLSNPSGPLLESQQNMATAYGAAATLYSAAGTTSCVQAMLAAFCPPGSAVAIARGCHVSAVRALALLGLVPYWIPLRGGRPHPDDVAAVLRQSGAKAVFVTGTDYYGRSADIPNIAQACRHFGAMLLCDNAHGAHLRFLRTNAHPLTLGADAVCDSAHKTLPALTGAAMVHLRKDTYAQTMRESLNLFSSTSPSYPILLSLDLCAGQLLSGALNFDAAAKCLAAVADTASSIHVACDDALRLVLCPALGGINTGDFHAGLLAAGIVPELFDGERIVLMASPCNTGEDFAVLQSILEMLLQKYPPDKSIILQNKSHSSPFAADALFTKQKLPPAVLPVRDATFSPRHSLPTHEAVGGIAASLAVPCPPGVPLVIPGEIITQPVANALLAGGISSVDVVK